MDQGSFYNQVWDVHSSEVPGGCSQQAALQTQRSTWLSLLNRQTHLFPLAPSKLRYHHSCLSWTPCATMTKKEIMELEKTLRKAARMMKGMDQLHEIRDTNAKMQKQPPVQTCSTPPRPALLPASREGEAGKGCSVHMLFMHSAFEQQATATARSWLTFNLSWTQPLTCRYTVQEGQIFPSLTDTSHFSDRHMNGCISAQFPGSRDQMLKSA